jgi:hypothetical protein
MTIKLKWSHKNKQKQKGKNGRRVVEDLQGCVGTNS